MQGQGEAMLSGGGLASGKSNCAAKMATPSRKLGDLAHFEMTHVIPIKNLINEDL